MARKKKIYRRMPGRPFSPIGFSSLWHGPDHLLWVESVFFKERYKRFYYNDIQSIVMHRTGTHWIWTFVWSALALLFGTIAYLVPGTPHVSGTFLAVCLAALVVNFVLGSSCLVYLQTAVQRQRLSSLRRVRTAGKAMERIKAFVEEHQGVWDQQAIADTLKTASDAGSPAPGGAAPTTAIQEPAKVPVGPFKPMLHRILFAVLLTMGVVGLLQMMLKSLPLGLLESLMHGAVQIMVIIALVRWYRHIKGTMIAKLNWMALAFIAFQTAVGYVLYFVVSFRHPEINYHHWALFKKMFELQMTEHPLALSGNIIYAGGCLLIGVFGMLLIQRQAKNLKS